MFSSYDFSSFIIRRTKGQIATGKIKKFGCILSISASIKAERNRRKDQMKRYGKQSHGYWVAALVLLLITTVCSIPMLPAYKQRQNQLDFRVAAPVRRCSYKTACNLSIKQMADQYEVSHSYYYPTVASVPHSPRIRSRSRIVSSFFSASSCSTRSKKSWLAARISFALR